MVTGTTGGPRLTGGKLRTMAVRSDELPSILSPVKEGGWSAQNEADPMAGGSVVQIQIDPMASSARAEEITPDMAGGKVVGQIPLADLDSGEMTLEARGESLKKPSERFISHSSAAVPAYAPTSGLGGEPCPDPPGKERAPVRNDTAVSGGLDANGILRDAATAKLHQEIP